MTAPVFVVALVVVLYGGLAACAIWAREHGVDGHRHQWQPGVMAAGYVYRTCLVCGHREYEVTG